LYSSYSNSVMMGTENSKQFRIFRDTLFSISFICFGQRCFGSTICARFVFIIIAFGRWPE